MQCYAVMLCMLNGQWAIGIMCVPWRGDVRTYVYMASGMDGWIILFAYGANGRVKGGNGWWWLAGSGRQQAANRQTFAKAKDETKCANCTFPTELLVAVDCCCLLLFTRR